MYLMDVTSLGFSPVLCVLDHKILKTWFKMHLNSSRMTIIQNSLRLQLKSYIFFIFIVSIVEFETPSSLQQL